MQEGKKKCKSCGEEIQSEANKCYRCGSSQILFWRIVKISNLLTACLLIVSVYQLNEASNERIDAKQALNKADTTAAQVTKMSDSVAITNSTLMRLSRYEIENAYIIASESGLAMGGDTPVRKKLESNLDSINRLISKDTVEQKKFWNDMNKLFEFRNKKK